jgi:RecA/RadA recombinase
MASKKTAKKKAPASKSQTTRAARARAEATTKNKAQPKADIDDVIAAVNKEMKGSVVRRASDMDTLYLLRRPTGIPTLDIAMGGGFPASATSVLVGPDGAGKDYLLWRTCAETQKIYGDEFCMVAFLTEFRADKPFMRNMCGLKVAFSDAEIESYNEAREKSGVEPLTEEEIEELKTEVGKIYIIDGVTAEQGFDALIRIIASNTCQIAVINSIGFLQTEAKEATESFTEFPQQRNEAMLLSKFMPKLAMTLNNDDNGRNETSLLIVNQVRSKDNAQAVRGRPTQERDKYEAGSKSYALKHGKAIEVFVHKGPKYRDAVDNTVIGRKTPWELTKGKLGTHDGKAGSFDFFYDGGADILGDLHAACLLYDVFETAGAWVTYDDEEFGFKAQGKEGVRRQLMDNPELVAHLKERVLQAANVVCRYR